MSRASDRVLLALRAFGIALPGAHYKSPWPGHKDLAVNDKTFCYLSLEGEPLSLSCKLPHSGEAVLSLPHTSPTAYGLGKSGWVSARFPDDALPPIEVLKQWIEESYRAQAPKRLVKQLDGAASDAPSKKTTRSEAAAPAKKAPKKKK